MAVQSPPRRAESPAALHGPRAVKPLKVVETVSSDGTWCCKSMVHSRSLPSSPASSRPHKSQDLCNASNQKVLHKQNSQSGRNTPKTVSSGTTQDAICSKLEKKIKFGEMSRAGEALKSGDVASLLKQGFIGEVSPLQKDNTPPFKLRLSPGRVSPIFDNLSPPISSNAVPSFLKLNSMLNTTGFVSQSSPPVEKTRASPTLFEMMAHERDTQEKPHPISGLQASSQATRVLSNHLSLQERLLSASNSPGSLFNDPLSSDVRLTLSSINKEGPSVTLYVHGHILAAHSHFFAAKLSDRWSKQRQDVPQIVQVSDCEDVEAYIDALRLMYSSNVKRKLLKESVSRVLGILKVCAAIVFDSGVLACLEYLEAVPWAEEEEHKVTTLLSQLQLESIGAGEVLQRLSTEDACSSQDVLVRLLLLVTKGTDEKARREMKALVSRMLRENAAHGKDSNDLSKESLYNACQGCLDSLLNFYMQATSSDIMGRLSEDRSMIMAQIIRQADNLNWLMEILIDRQIADEFVRLWANQVELVSLHGQVPIALGRYEVSRVTARLCVAVGQGEIMAPKDIRYQLLHRWLQLLIDDFGWMQRVCRGLDRKVVEEGISQAILTLPLKQQQTIMIAWFDRFLKNGDDCPNLQRAFEIWWRRTFTRPQGDSSCPSPRQAPLQQHRKSGEMHNMSNSQG